MTYRLSELTHLLIDLDDTIYPSTKGVWGLIQVRIDRYLIDVMGVPFDETRAVRRRLFLTYGTTLRGLQIENNIDMRDYLDYVHDISLEGVLDPAPELSDILARFPQQKWIFTNASASHAVNVLSSMGLRDQFVGIIDVAATNPWCKPHVEAFQIALGICGNPDPKQCLFIDDSARNLDTAAGLNLKTALISDQLSLAHPTISRLELLEELLNVV
jgi:putative hydrolase of the HAD superfamily